MPFQSLSDDVMGLILLEVHNSSRETLFSTLRTSKALHDSTKPLIFRDCRLNLSGSKIDETNGRITSWIETETEVLSHIRQLTIVDDAYHYYYSADNGAINEELKYSSLIRLLSQLPGLVKFTFSLHKPMPIKLLDALHSSQPNIQLHIRNWTRKSIDTRFGDPGELALASSPLLRTIHASVYDGDGEIDLQRAAFMRIVVLAPNLESYSWSSHSTGGCVIHMMSHEQYQEEAQLRKEFDVDQPVKKVLKAVHIDHEVSWVKNQAGIVDLSKLERLEGVHVSRNIDVGLGDIFSSLKVLDIQVMLWRTEINLESFQGFLCSLPSLEELSILDGLTYINLNGLMSYHGPTLHTLQLHETENTSLQDPRKTLSLDDLCLIRDSCPHLCNLGIDISYVRADPQEGEVYTVLSTFGNIHSLTLNYDLGIGLQSFFSQTDSQHEGIQHQINALIDRDNVSVKLQAIWAEAAGPKLQQLLIQIGKQDREIGKGYPAHWVLYEQNMRTWHRMENGMIVASKSKNSFDY
ncbi:hypothetical protein VKT23_015728 [Stygiomarasmius scandens]|uniref:F-box domain-containing protein n=1 Tax=Marasmiellus scandens TaxID=2682957 RepID=A0ABR1J0B4_9AGAR